MKLFSGKDWNDIILERANIGRYAPICYKIFEIFPSNKEIGYKVL